MRGQTSIEYLLLLAAMIVVAGIVVFLVLGSQSTIEPVVNCNFTGFDRAAPLGHYDTNINWPTACEPRYVPVNQGTSMNVEITVGAKVDAATIIIKGNLDKEICKVSGPGTRPEKLNPPLKTQPWTYVLSSCTFSNPGKYNLIAEVTTTDNPEKKTDIEAGAVIAK